MEQECRHNATKEDLVSYDNGLLFLKKSEYESQQLLEMAHAEDHQKRGARHLCRIFISPDFLRCQNLKARLVPVYINFRLAPSLPYPHSSQMFMVVAS